MLVQIESVSLTTRKCPNLALFGKKRSGLINLEPMQLVVGLSWKDVLGYLLSPKKDTLL
jgi:hypothetical protein